MNETPGRRVASSTPHDLDRFVIAQVEVHAQAMRELARGLKTSHWMWFIFPQIAGLGRSARAQRYAIADLAEARAYLAHPILGPHLLNCTQAVVAWVGRRSACQIFGDIDATKLRSSATLFEAAGGDPAFGALLDAHFDGVRDPATLQLLGDRLP